MKKGRFIRTIRKSGTSYAVNIPPEIIKLMDLKEGDIVNINVEKVEG